MFVYGLGEGRLDMEGRVSCSGRMQWDSCTAEDDEGRGL
jgi:hypothetical protein